MHKSILLSAPVLLVACAAAPAQPVIHGNTPGHVCDAAKASEFIGKPGTKGAGAAIKHLTKAAVLRWAPPGYMLTMDFRSDRVNIWLDSERKITRITCG